MNASTSLSMVSSLTSGSSSTRASSTKRLTFFFRSRWKIITYFGGGTIRVWSTTYFLAGYKWIPLQAQRTETHSSVSFCFTVSSISTKNVSARIYTLFIDTCFVVGTIIINKTFVLKTFFMRIASPVWRTATYCPMRGSLTQCLFPAWLRYDARIETLMFYACLVVSTLGIMITFASPYLGALNIWISSKSRRTSTSCSVIVYRTYCCWTTWLISWTRIDTVSISACLTRWTFWIRWTSYWLWRKYFITSYITLASISWFAGACHCS